ncbi:hypothetical protein R3W88_007075 [Solanum pinnatisectum]|uniref:Uncharacterized protein n=1 Tax=Solanum pinnatisectum TaxID=50273 RepID=A0AAV9KHB3_9SOLN|nr:hypothetical protein R3W88_007075 [Solanum pinnatisectum]
MLDVVRAWRLMDSLVDAGCCCCLSPELLSFDCCSLEMKPDRVGWVDFQCFGCGFARSLTSSLELVEMEVWFTGFFGLESVENGERKGLSCFVGSKFTVNGRTRARRKEEGCFGLGFCWWRASSWPVVSRGDFGLSEVVEK